MLQGYGVLDRTGVGGPAEWEKMADSVCILRIEPIGFSDRLNIQVRERWVEDGAMIFALSKWKIGNAVNQAGDGQVSAQEDRDLKFYLNV